MVRLERETSNSFGADLFEVLEDWEFYLQAEHIDFEKLAQGNEIKALSETNAIKSEVKNSTRPRVKQSVQRLEP